jgi:AraC-like DNA-binding protein
MLTGTVTILLLVGAAQGILLAALILQKYRRLYANRFIAAMMFTLSMILVNLLLNDIGFYNHHPRWLNPPLSLPFLIGPLYYLYARFAISPQRRFRRKDFLHYIPFLLIEAYLSLSSLRPKQELVSMLQSVDSGQLPRQFLAFDAAIIIHLLIYIFQVLSVLKRFSHDIKSVFSTIDKIRLDWLRNISLMELFLLLVFIVEACLLLAGIHTSHIFSLTSLFFAIFVYSVGYMALLRSEVLSASITAESVRHISPAIHPEQKETTGQSRKYEKSGLSADKAEAYLEKLLSLMEEKRLYQESDLTLPQLAGEMAVSPHNVSEILNTRLHQSFFDFVNSYRIQEAKEQLGNAQKQHLKILAIAYEAGFRSKATFNTLFKKSVGLTPSQYRQQVLGYASSVG